MHQRILEIVVFLADELNRRGGELKDIAKLSDDLRRQGYTENEISAALSWLFERLEEGRRWEGTTYSGVRVLHEVERRVLSPEAYGYLLQLRALGLITPGQMEATIERAIMTGAGRVDKEDIKALVASLLFGEGVEGGETLH
ncbi:MAG: hypothetical protein DRQ08_07160 [Candidatus Latescibacterota bacterium]|nr:MAG: hypothetical protein DRQ08_07160 [Candidatus Latescibacterota bacterium]